jgi:hypothetical protein
MSSARTTTLQKVIPYSSPIPWILQWRWPSSEVLAVIRGRIECSCLLALDQGRPFLATTVIYVITCILFICETSELQKTLYCCVELPCNHIVSMVSMHLYFCVQLPSEPCYISDQCALIFQAQALSVYVPAAPLFIFSGRIRICIISRFIFLTGEGVSKDLDSYSSRRRWVNFTSMTSNELHCSFTKDLET